MLKTSTGLFLLFIIASALSATAQKTDSLRADTNQLNKYRIDPGKNSLPLRYRPIQIQQDQVPVTMMDYKVSYWHKSVTFQLNFAQSAFSNNYSAGGVNAIALNSNFDFKAEYNKTPFDYTTELNLIYGISKNKGQGSRKTNDRIFYDNKVASQLSKHWFFFGSLTFESQFDKGYQYGDGVSIPDLLISNFLAPGYITESAGWEYKPNKFFDLRLGAAAIRQTFVDNETIIANVAGSYGTNGKTFENDPASQLVATFDKDIMKNLHLNARYALFIPYTRGFADITHRVDFTLTAKVNRLINVTMNGTFLYDTTSGSKQPQGTEGLALGVVYSFP
jgi:hypothetical protein